MLSQGAFGGPCGSLGIFCWSHRDTAFDWFPLPISQFDDETELATNVVAPHSDIVSVDLDEAKKSRAKILMWHGETDQLIPWRQSVHYYREAAQRFGGFEEIAPWFRFYVAPGVNHCQGGTGPQPQNLFGVLVNWVENGTAPDSILAQGGSLNPARTRPLCPYPQTAVFKSGDADVASSFECGGNLETREAACMDQVAKFQKETQRPLDMRGLDVPGACVGKGHERHSAKGHDD